MVNPSDSQENRNNIANVSGQGHKTYQGICDSTITDNSVNYTIVQSSDYQKLIKEIVDKQEMIELCQAAGRTHRAITLGAELEQLEQQLESFKENVFRLYETFNRIEIDTERLRKAKAHFDQGEFREADAVLDEPAMATDLGRLVAREQQLDREKAEIAQGRTQLANEYGIKARLWATFYEKADWFDQTREYFEQSLQAKRNAESVFEYALFLKKHNCLGEAQPLYEEALRYYRESAQENPRTFLPYVASTLNNLAILQKAQNDYGMALQSYEAALQIYRELAQENPRTFLPYVASTLNNLGLLQQAQNGYDQALQFYEEALHYYQDLATENPRTFLPDVAHTLNNLGLLQQAQNDYDQALQSYEEALRYYREFAAENPRTFLPYAAHTLNNLGLLQQAQNGYDQALQSYEEALQYYREFAAENPRTFLPDVAMTVINLSIFYLQAVPNPEKSIALATEVLEIAQQFPQVPIVQRYAETAHQVLLAHGVTPSP